MKKLLGAIFITCFSLGVIAQQNNIQVGTADMLTYSSANFNSLNEHLALTGHIQYQKALKKIPLKLLIKYTFKPYNFNIQNDPPSNGLDLPIWAETGDRHLARGAQHFIDLGIHYPFYKIKNHQFSINLSSSVVFGKESYWTIYAAGGEAYFEPRSDDILKSHLGLMSVLNYDYFIWKDQLNIGIDASIRYYFTGKNQATFPTTIMYGIHLGYNF